MSMEWPEFVYSVGEEGSDPIVDVQGLPFRHDQYAQSGHYHNMTQDLRAIAGLGVKVVRYGMPWRRAEPHDGEYDWSLWDRALEAIARVRADRGGKWMSSEGFDVHVDPSGTMHRRLERRQAINWLVWDLHFGLDPLPAAAQYLDVVDDGLRDRISELAVSDNVIAGHDFYPTSVQ